MVTYLVRKARILQVCKGLHHECLPRQPSQLPRVLMGLKRALPEEAR